MDLTLVAAGVLVFGVAMYVVLDGFDLGVGILFPWASDEHERDIMMASIAPIWDGNETWLVLGGTVLFAAFPQAYAILLNALYGPIMLMLFVLIFRGVAFEFRSKSRASRRWWNLAFAGGSTVAAFAQGIVLGALVSGIEVADGYYAGGPWDWLHPFSVMTGLALVAGYALLGATWLIMKTEGSLQNHCRKRASGLFWIVMVFVVLVSVWTPLLEPAYAQRWFRWPQVVFLSPVPVATALFGWLLWRAVREAENTPFAYAVVLFLIAYGGLLYSIWPYVIPASITLWDAAGSPGSLRFTLSGVLILLPIILVYTLYTYRVFRGKVDVDEHYH